MLLVYPGRRLYMPMHSGRQPEQQRQVLDDMIASVRHLHLQQGDGPQLVDIREEVEGTVPESSEAAAGPLDIATAASGVNLPILP